MTVISARPPLPNLTLPASTAPLEFGKLLEGERLGQFVLQQCIGGGGMGVVFRALDATLNREVAVKVLSRDQSSDEEALRRFRNEAQSAARLDHENIARVHYVGEDRGVHYIVFEFIEGTNIRDLVEQQGPLSQERAISYTFQIAQALEHASQRAVIHRDIKPSNVLITPDGKAKLVDMGLARLNLVAHDNELTASGITLGTFDYISPEQARDPRSADVRSDLYSLGCSLFYMLTGRPPFPDGTVLQKLLQHQADHPPDPRTIRAELPEELTYIVGRLLAKNPALRYQMPSELIADLSTLADKLGMRLSAPRGAWVDPRSPDPRARWRHHLPWVIPVTALFLIVLLLDHYWSAQPEQAAHPSAASGTSTRSAAEPSKRADPGKSPRAPAEPQTDRVPNAAQPAPNVRPPAQEHDAAGDDPSTTTKSGNNVVSGLSGLAKAWGKQLGSKQPAGRAAGEANSAASADSESTPPESVSSPSASAGAVEEPPGGPSAGLLVVSDSSSGPGIYPSLFAACGEAKNSDIIELRFNGPRIERPITISNLKLTIRAGQKFRPIVVFQPEFNSSKFPPAMVTVVGGQLLVNNVQWQLAPPKDTPADWTLFEMRRAESLRFEQCTFSVRGTPQGVLPFQSGSAIFEVKAPPGAGSMAMDGQAQEERIVNIHLQDCIARGDAVFLRDHDLQPLRLEWNNGLLAIREQLLTVAGSPTQSRDPGRIQLTLRHLTARPAAGLVLLTNSDDAPYQLPVEIECEDSIITGMSRSPLVEQRGPDQAEAYRTRFQWKGSRDFFDGFDVFWRIESATTPTQSWGFAQWESFWGQPGRLQFVSREDLLWKRLPSSTKPFYAHSPDDYVLNADRGQNAAVAAAGDGLDAGFVAARLPEIFRENDSEARQSPLGTLPRGSDGKVFQVELR